MTGVNEITLESFTTQMLTDFKTLADTMYGASSNAYLETVTIPTYDSGDSSHLLITEANGNWTSTNLNSSTYKHFYVEPGDYSSSIITLTADGTTGDRRSISLYNGNDTHPASLTTAQQADIKIVFDNADYWDISRMSFLSYQAHVDVKWLYNGASYNVFDRLHLKDFYYGIRILHGSNYNTIQRSYLDTITSDGRLSDNMGIALTTADHGDGTTIVGTKLIENDIKNCGDSIHFSVPSDPPYGYEVSYEGTIIDNNRLWVDNTIYYDDYIDDGGVLDPNGMYSLSENAIDFKAGSLNESNPVKFTNNICWGFRNNATGGGRGKAFSLMYSPKNVNVENNIFYDTERGMATNKPSATSYSAENFTLKNNIFHSCNNTLGDVYGLDIGDGLNTLVEDNSIINLGTGEAVIFRDNSGTTSYKRNLAINSSRLNHSSGSLDAEDNYNYNTTNDINGTDDINGGVASNALMDDYTFQYDRYTGSPKSKTITDAITTTASPHYGVAGSDIRA